MDDDKHVRKRARVLIGKADGKKHHELIAEGISQGTIARTLQSYSKHGLRNAVERPTNQPSLLPEEIEAAAALYGTERKDGGTWNFVNLAAERFQHVSHETLRKHVYRFLGVNETENNPER